MGRCPYASRGADLKMRTVKAPISYHTQEVVNPDKKRNRYIRLCTVTRYDAAVQSSTENLDCRVRSLQAKLIDVLWVLGAIIREHDYWTVRRRCSPKLNAKAMAARGRRLSTDYYTSTPRK